MSFLKRLEKIREEYGANRLIPKIPNEMTTMDVYGKGDDDPIDILLNSYKFMLEHGQPEKMIPYWFPFFFGYDVGSVNVFFVNLSPLSSPDNRYMLQRFGRETDYTSGVWEGDMHLLRLPDESLDDVIYLGDEEDYEETGELLKVSINPDEYSIAYNPEHDIEEEILLFNPYIPHIQYLLEAGEYPSSSYVLRLHYCNKSKVKDELFDLILSYSYPEDQNILDIAIRRGYSTIVKDLLSLGVKPYSNILKFSCSEGKYIFSKDGPPHVESPGIRYATSVAVDDYVSPLAEYEAQRKGDLDVLKILHHYGYYPLEGTNPVSDAVYNGNPHLLHWLEEIGYSTKYLGRFLVDVLRSHEMPSERMYALFNFYLDFHHPFSSEINSLPLKPIYREIYEKNLLEDLKRLASLGVYPDQETVDEIFSRSISLLKWAESHHLPLDRTAAENALNYGSLEALEWFLIRCIYPLNQKKWYKYEEDAEERIRLLEKYDVDGNLKKPNRIMFEEDYEETGELLNVSINPDEYSDLYIINRRDASPRRMWQVVDDNSKVKDEYSIAYDQEHDIDEEYPSFEE